jgi:hypothetical protein
MKKGSSAFLVFRMVFNFTKMKNNAIMNLIII